MRRIGYMKIARRKSGGEKAKHMNNGVFFNAGEIPRPKGHTPEDREGCARKTKLERPSRGAGLLVQSGGGCQAGGG